MMRSRHGFSLVELIVAVAIIGILASLTVPMYKKLAFKTRQSEAKMNLSGLFTAEKSFYSEYLAYHSSFLAIGFSPEGSIRYNVGFNNSLNFSADASNGYNAPLAPAELLVTSTKDYCSTLGDSINPASLGAPGNGCRTLSTSMNAAGSTLPAALPFYFAVYKDNFAAGAMILLDQDLALAIPPPFPQDEIIATIAVPSTKTLFYGAHVIASILTNHALASFGLPVVGSTDTLAIDSNGQITQIKCPLSQWIAGTLQQKVPIWDGTNWSIQTTSSTPVLGVGVLLWSPSGGSVTLATTTNALGEMSYIQPQPISKVTIQCDTNFQGF